MDNADLLLDAPPPPQRPPPLPPRPAAQPVNFKLPEFWVDAPVAWFGAVEAQFRLRHVESEADRFCLVTQALHKETVRQVMHLVADPDPEQPYSLLKQALLASHLLTDFQRVEQLLAMEPLGDRKPSQLLAAMLEVCPRDEHGSKLFVALFLQRLPRELRVLLAHDDHSNLRQLAAKADQLQAFHKQQGHELVAAAGESSSGDLVAALKKGGGGGGGHGKKKGGPPPMPPNRKKEGPPTPRDLAQVASGMCTFHWRYGDNARRCTAPCNYQQGN